MTKFIFGLALGCLAGSMITYYIQVDKMEKKVDDEIRNFVKDYEEHNTKQKGDELKEGSNNDAPSESSINSQYKKIVTEYNKCFKEDEKDKIDTEFIKPEDFGEDFGYDCTYYTLYSNGVVTDENGDVLENESFILGSNWKEGIGKYEADICYIRNNARRIDIEIAVDQTEYVKKGDQ